MFSWKDLIGPAFDRILGGSKDKYNEEVAKYNREVDIATLQLALRRFGHERELNEQGILDAQFRANVAQRGVEQATNEAATEQFRRTYLRDLSESEALRTEYLARGRFDVARDTKRTRMAELRAQGALDQATRNVLFAEEHRDDRLYNAAALVRGQQTAQADVLDDVARRVFGAGQTTRTARRAALAVEGTAAADVFRAGEGTRGARSRRLALGAGQQARTMAAEREVVGARSTTLGAERTALRGTTAAGMFSLAEQRRGVIGAGTVSRAVLQEQRAGAGGAALADAASRGLATTSSAATVATAEAETAYRREMALQAMEEDVQLAGIGRQQAELQGRAGTGEARLAQGFTELHRDAGSTRAPRCGVPCRS